MEHSADPVRTLGTQELVDLAEPAHRGQINRDGILSLGNRHIIQTALAGLFTKDTRSNKRIRAAFILIDHGEPWIVDSKGSDKFKVAVDTSPVTRQWAAAQLCDPVFGHPCHECTRDPYPEAVLTCVDHCDTGPCVVVVFGGWDDAVLLIGMTRPDRDLTDAKG